MDRRGMHGLNRMQEWREDSGVQLRQLAHRVERTAIASATALLLGHVQHSYHAAGQGEHQRRRRDKGVFGQVAGNDQLIDGAQQ